MHPKHFIGISTLEKATSKPAQITANGIEIVSRFLME